MNPQMHIDHQLSVMVDSLLKLHSIAESDIVNALDNHFSKDDQRLLLIKMIQDSLEGLSLPAKTLL